MWGYAPGVYGGVTADPGSPRRQQGSAQPPRLHRSGRTPDMTGYLIADVTDVKDASLYQRYKPLVPASLQAFNGTSLTRGGSVTVLEGSWHPERIVVVRFDSAARAMQWWASDEYREARGMRQAATETNMIVVEGVA